MAHHHSVKTENRAIGVIDMLAGAVGAVAVLLAMKPVQEGFAAFAKASFSVPQYNSMGPIENTAPGPIGNPMNAPEKAGDH